MVFRVIGIESGADVGQGARFVKEDPAAVTARILAKGAEDQKPNAHLLAILGLVEPRRASAEFHHLVGGAEQPRDVVGGALTNFQLSNCGAIERSIDGGLAEITRRCREQQNRQKEEGGKAHVGQDNASSEARKIPRGRLNSG